MEFIARGSEVTSFLACRKEWLYQYIEKIEPIKPNGKLFFGTVFHKYLEYLYQEKEFSYANRKTHAFINANDLSAMEQVEIDELKDLFDRMSLYYWETYKDDMTKWKVIATELKFLVNMQDDIMMTGTIDLVIEDEHGDIYFIDHKTTTSIDRYVSKSVMDRQISRYWWALRMIQDGVGRVWDDKNGIWIPYFGFKDKEIKGFIYNIIAKETPKEPKVLKNGTLSKDKAQKTTWELYDAKLMELGLPIDDYVDILHHLRDKPNPFLRRVEVTRTDAELESAAWEFFYTACDIHDVKLMVTEKPELTDQMTYRNISDKCMTMCSYQSLCQAAISGHDVDVVKVNQYKIKEEVE